MNPDNGRVSSHEECEEQRVAGSLQYNSREKEWGVLTHEECKVHKEHEGGNGGKGSGIGES